MRLKETMRALRALTVPGGSPGAAEPIWEGVYERFRDVPVSGAGHESEEWIQGSLAEARRALADASAEEAIPLDVTEERALLPLLASIVSEGQGGRVRILDFGGGAGADYARVCASVPRAAMLEYHVVEIDSLCRAGRKLFSGDDRVRFHGALPEDLAAPDIVHVCSSLQYVEDYAGVLKKLCALGAPYVLFIKLSAGEIRSFATAQKNVGNSSIPYWFLSLAEVIDLMAREGYVLAFKGSLARVYAQDALPPERRVPRMVNLLFVRRGHKTPGVPGPAGS
jgi:putative methyltransferase (TIGR04325 family)